MHCRYQNKFDQFSRTALKSLSTPLDLQMYTMSSSRSNTTTAIGTGTANSVSAEALVGGGGGGGGLEPSLLEYYVDMRTGMFASWRDAGVVERIYASLGPSIDLPIGSDRDRSRQTAAPDRALTCSAHTHKYLHLFDTLLGAERPLLVAGASGVGKSSFLEVFTFS